VTEAYPVHHDIRGEHSSFVFTSAGDIAFALRTTLAGLAALFTAMWLQLDVPRWAMWTVFIVSPPVRGNALRKTAARLVGTVTGSVIAVAIVGWFPQDRGGFYVVFAGWLGTCAYWATLRRGYVSYAAILAAFTSAIIAADVASAPLAVWQAAVDRGSATLVGVIFAYFASEMLARSDDVPADLANRVRALSGDVLDWAVRQLESAKSDEPKDAPFTAQIFALNEACSNAIAERPALGWVKPRIIGLPTALLALQSSALRLRHADAYRLEPTAIARLKETLRKFATFMQSTAPLNLQSVRQQALFVVDVHEDGIRSQNRAIKEIVSALLYLLAGFEAILTLRPPVDAPPLYPEPKFAAHPEYATTNLIRTVAGMLLGFIIWDVTAWSSGDIFMANVAVALVLFVAMDDPIAGNWPNLIGNLIGGLVGLGGKYLVLVHTTHPLTLIIFLFPALFVGAWMETKPKLATLGLFSLNGLAILLDPRNPQQYDFVHDINVLIALTFAYAFVPMIFLAIGAPARGSGRIAELLARLRRYRGSITPGSTRHERLLGESQMYDEFQRLQAVTNDPALRERAMNVLLSAN
jgi:uncharacterized membrane protein YccC